MNRPIVDSVASRKTTAKTRKRANAQASMALINKKRKDEKDIQKRMFDLEEQDSILTILLNNDPNCDPTTPESKLDAVNLLDDVVKSFGYNMRCQKLSDADTAHVLHAINLSHYQARELRRVLNFLSEPKASFNIFSSDHKVYAHKAKFEAKMNVKTIKVGSEDETREFAVVDNFIQNLQTRLQRLIDSAIGGDYGGEFMKITNTIGNTSKRNDPNNISLIAMCKKKSSRKQLFEALEDIAKQVNETAEIDLIINGAPEKFKVRWFLEGDLEFILDTCGKKSASSAHPCPYCFFRKYRKTIAEHPASLLSSTNRQNFDEREPDEVPPLFNIPPDQIVLPCLHIFLGIGQRLVSALETELKRLDFEKLTPEERQNFEDQVAVENTCQTLRDRLSEKQAELEQLQSNLDGFQQLNDYIFDHLKENPYLDNSTLPGGCQLPFCVERAGFPIDTATRNCDCTNHEPVIFHRFCLGYYNSRPTITCHSLQSFFARNIFAKNISSMLSREMEAVAANTPK
uniref:Uncharacterized protein n=1 Tax=Panagrolaimus sp. JU765 TaxID=591449 RepID=A0AC34RGM1_9BILA